MRLLGVGLDCCWKMYVGQCIFRPRDDILPIISLLCYPTAYTSICWRKYVFMYIIALHLSRQHTLDEQENCFFCALAILITIEVGCGNICEYASMFNFA